MNASGDTGPKLSRVMSRNSAAARTRTAAVRSTPARGVPQAPVSPLSASASSGGTTM